MSHGKLSNMMEVPAKGRHCIVEMNGAINLTDHVSATDKFREAARVAGAKGLDINMHSFKSEGMSEAGFTGVAILAESHMSIHTWPEEGYAAVDIFMCGDSKPEDAVALLAEWFSPGEVFACEIVRQAGKSPQVQDLKLNFNLNNKAEK